ncbi:MAG: Asparagine synthase, glutamine-hydrolyzing [Alphaproteobacteria bacterium]|nr:Asparagine synthase, glutamine-hydrolyzing [Alphaproteobacteria bacterium]
MCGLAGFFGFNNNTSDRESIRTTLARMTGRIAHRGPDADGFWLDYEAGIALGHRRLSIIDLSEAGAQPMTSASGRYLLSYNGEIYNHLELRAALGVASMAPDWRGHSDTETLLACFEAWGVEAALQKATGMFAFALWDREKRALVLGRDRLGEKPLYYGWQGRGGRRAFLFGSELKSLRVHPAFENEVDRDALMLLMRHGYVPAPYSIYSGIRKLPPGTYATLSRDEPEPHIRTYWSAIETARRGAAQPFAGTPDEAVDILADLLGKAVGRQMMADVPLGAFLSGGIDSSTIVALMQAQSSRPVRTFSIGFHEGEYDEAVHARAVARHLGTDHTELYVTSSDAMGVIPRLPEIYDEPFADSSQIPTFLVSRLARSAVTVSLSGDGGDELFGGYNRYKFSSSLWNSLAPIPLPLRGLAGSAVTAVPVRAWNRVGAALPGRLKYNLLGDKLHKGAGILRCRSADELYYGLVSLWRNPEAIVRGATEPPTQLTGGRPDLAGLDPVERMMALDLVTYLPDDILVKVDRASMAVSLESRVPLLDPEVVAFAWSLPLGYKMRGGETKWPLRQLLYRHVPRALIDRPKMGFGVPVGDWLRGPMRDWGEALLDERRLRSEGFLHVEAVRAAWATHLGGSVNLQYSLWPILMLQQWLEAQAEPVQGAAVPQAA